MILLWRILFDNFPVYGKIFAYWHYMASSLLAALSSNAFAKDIKKILDSVGIKEVDDSLVQQGHLWAERKKPWRYQSLLRVSAIWPACPSPWGRSAALAAASTLASAEKKDGKKKELQESDDSLDLSCWSRVLLPCKSDKMSFLTSAVSLIPHSV